MSEVDTGMLYHECIVEQRHLRILVFLQEALAVVEHNTSIVHDAKVGLGPTMDEKPRRLPTLHNSEHLVTSQASTIVVQHNESLARRNI